MIGLALAVCYGATAESGRLAAMVGRLLSREDELRATAWGLALRLGQRLTAGTAQPLTDSSISRRSSELVLRLHPTYADLYGEVVERRLKAFADLLGLKPRTEIGK
jgi:exopolyphosphatase / guanosine-5'-triphosphate,3'-diphosphate pyrophosphatase